MIYSVNQQMLDVYLGSSFYSTFFFYLHKKQLQADTPIHPFICIFQETPTHPICFFSKQEKTYELMDNPLWVKVIKQHPEKGGTGMENFASCFNLYYFYQFLVHVVTSCLINIWHQLQFHMIAYRLSRLLDHEYPCNFSLGNLSTTVNMLGLSKLIKGCGSLSIVIVPIFK